MNTQHIFEDARVLVTGACGGLGAHLVERLLLQGVRVRAVDRISIHNSFLANTPWVQDPRVEWIQEDLVRSERLGTLMEGCDAVIHAAADVTLRRDDDAFAHSNVEMVRELYIASQEAEVRHFVHISCGSVYALGAGLRGEEADTDLTNAYERSKHNAESILSVDVDGDVPWTILRPALVYGPYCRTMGAALVTWPPMLRMLMRYLPGWTGGSRLSWCHAADVADAAILVLGKEEAFRQTYNVSDATPIALGEIITSITEAYGLDVGPSLPFPGFLAGSWFEPLVNQSWLFDNLHATACQMWRQVCTDFHLTSPLRPLLDRKALGYATGDAILDASKLRALGWCPNHDDFREGIMDAIRWYQQVGWVPRYDTQSLIERKERREERGPTFHEFLRGTWEDLDSNPSEVSLALDISFPRKTGFSTVFRGHLDGQVCFEGLTPTPVKCQGTIVVSLLEASMTYEFGFKTMEGDVYRFLGHKHWSRKEPVSSIERLEGRLVDARGIRHGDAWLIFDLGEQFVPMLLSSGLLTPWRAS